jgi:hypothetical protein
MSSTITATARRFALTLTVAGIAALGSVAVAPAASAAQSDVVINDNGPDAFVILEHGKMPVFECDPINMNKQHNNCLRVYGDTRF